jgi:hypothetical protein
MTDAPDFDARARRSLEDYGPGDACTICDAPVEGFGHCFHCSARIVDPVTCVNCDRSVLRAGVCIGCCVETTMAERAEEPEQGGLL